MKTLKIIFFFSFLFLFNQNNFAQNAYTRALSLVNLKKKPKLFASIDSFRVNKEFWEDSLGTTTLEYRTARHFGKFIEDPFFERIDLSLVSIEKYEKIAKKYNYFTIFSPEKQTKVVQTKSKTIIISNIEMEANNKSVMVMSVPQDYSAGFSTGAIIDGTARFLVKRTKEELELAFFEKFKEEIKKDSVLQELIPQTYLLLRYQDYAYIPSMGETWTSAITTDLNNIPFGLTDAILKHKTELLDEEGVLVFLTAMMSAKQLSDNLKPYEIIYNLDKKIGTLEIPNGKANVSKYIHLTNLLSYNLLNEVKNAPQGWITKDDFTSLQAEGFRYFWAFLYHENKDFFQNKLKWDVEKIKNASAGIISVEDFLQSAQQTNEILSSFSGSNVNKMTSATQELLKLVGAVVKLEFIIEGKSEEFSNGIFIKKYKPLVDNSLNILKNAEQRNYGAAMLNTLRVVNDIFPEDKKNNNESVKRLIFYLNFMTDVLTADEAVGVKQVIERYALPPQSYRMKRTISRSVDLNAFPGVFAGFESLTRTQNLGRAAGITAPIGLSFNYGHLGKNENQSFSFFFPVIDIGAAFSYRWGKDADSKGFPASISWQQVFAPGLYFVWGLPRSPISLSAGAQLTPQLRTIIDGASTLKANTFRYGITTSIDIPVFNLWKTN